MKPIVNVNFSDEMKRSLNWRDKLHGAPPFSLVTMFGSQFAKVWGEPVGVGTLCVKEMPLTSYSDRRMDKAKAPDASEPNQQIRNGRQQ